MAAPVLDWDNSRVHFSGGIIEVRFQTTPYPYRSCAWSRSGTTCTITANGHGLSNGESVGLYLSSSVTAIPTGTYTVGNVATNTFDVTVPDAGSTSGTAYMIYRSAAHWPSIKRNAGSAIPCPQYVWTHYSLIIRVPDASLVQAGETVTITLPAGVVSDNAGTPAGNALVTDQGITNGTGVEILTYTIPENAADMPLGQGVVVTPYYKNNCKWTDALRQFSYELNTVNYSQALWASTSRDITVNAYGLPTSMGETTPVTIGFGTGSDDPFYPVTPGRTFPEGVYTLRWKGASAPSIVGETPTGFGTNGDWNYRLYNLTGVTKTSLQVQLSGLVDDLQLIMPGYSVDGGDPTQEIHDDWLRLNKSISTLRMMAYTHCNTGNNTRMSEFPPSTWKFDSGYAVTHIGEVTGVEQVYNRWWASDNAYEITHDIAGDMVDTCFSEAEAPYATYINGVAYLARVRTAANKFVVNAASAPTVGHSIRLTMRSKGPPLSRMVGLCNATGKHLWCNVPKNFLDDGEVRAFADYIRDTLNEELTVYVEYANEMWNYVDARRLIQAMAFTDPYMGRPVTWARSGSGPYTITVTQSAHGYGTGTQTIQICNSSAAGLDGYQTCTIINTSSYSFEVADDPGASGTALAKKYATDWNTMQLQWYGKRSAEIHEIFRQSFAVTGRTAAKRVVTGQAVNTSLMQGNIYLGYKNHCEATYRGGSALTFTYPDYYGWAMYLGSHPVNFHASSPLGPDFFANGSGSFSAMSAEQWMDSVYCQLDHHNLIRAVQNADYLKAYNLANGSNIRGVIYECGLVASMEGFAIGAKSMDGGTYSEAQYNVVYERMLQIKRHPRSALITLESLRYCLATEIVDLYVNFTDYGIGGSSGNWGMCEFQWQVSGPGDGTQGDWDNRTDLSDPDNQAVVAYAYDLWAGEYVPPEPEPEPPPAATKLVIVKRSP